ncbi:10059_t:CDS:1, partial [Funneliformis caledonium]
INLSLSNEIDDFFDNISENEEDLTSLFTEVAINKARELLISNLDNVDNDSESTDWDTDSAFTIASESTEAEDEIIIPQTSSLNLTLCALIDIINGSIQSCSEVKNLQGLVQLVST